VGRRTSFPELITSKCFKKKGKLNTSAFESNSRNWRGNLREGGRFQIGHGLRRAAHIYVDHKSRVADGQRSEKHNQAAEFREVVRGKFGHRYFERALTFRKTQSQTARSSFGA